MKPGLESLLPDSYHSTELNANIQYFRTRPNKFWRQRTAGRVKSRKPAPDNPGRAFKYL